MSESAHSPVAAASGGSQDEDQQQGAAQLASEDPHPGQPALAPDFVRPADPKTFDRLERRETLRARSEFAIQRLRSAGPVGIARQGRGRPSCRRQVAPLNEWQHRNPPAMRLRCHRSLSHHCQVREPHGERPRKARGNLRGSGEFSAPAFGQHRAAAGQGSCWSARADPGGHHERFTLAWAGSRRRTQACLARGHRRSSLPTQRPGRRCI